MDNVHYIARIATERIDMSIGKFRPVLYFLVRLLGDINAIRRGRIGERILRRLVGRLFR